MSITLILYLVGGGAILTTVIVIIVKLKQAKKDRSENKTLKKYNKAIVKTEQQKNDIRVKHDEKANDIVNNPNGASDVLPVVSREHNHKFRDPCTEDCPAYTGE